MYILNQFLVYHNTSKFDFGSHLFCRVPNMNYMYSRLYQVRNQQWYDNNEMIRQFVNTKARRIENCSDLKVGDYLYEKQFSAVDNNEIVSYYFYRIVRITNKRICFQKVHPVRGKISLMCLRKNERGDGVSDAYLSNISMRIYDYIKEEDFDSSLPCLGFCIRY
jgi:hypothetical protein